MLNPGGMRAGWLLGLGAISAQANPGALTPDELLIRESHRTSSTDPSGGNRDFFDFAPGKQKLLLNVERKSGAITRLWCTMNTKAPDYLDQVRLRFVFDGKTTVDEVPLGMFFATGPWQMNDVLSGRVNVMRARPGNADDAGVGRGSFNAYWEMPFSESARIEVLNGTAEPMTLHFNIDYFTRPAWESPPLLFHAAHHLEDPTKKGAGDVTLDSAQDYLLADIRGQEGFYAGTVLCIESHPAREGKWYEEDETFIVDDGSWETALHGTGTEDYFGMAWGVLRPYQAFDHGGKPLRAGPNRRRPLLRWPLRPLSMAHPRSGRLP